MKGRLRDRNHPVRTGTRARVLVRFVTNGRLTASTVGPMLVRTTGSARRTQVRASIEFKEPHRLAPAIAAWIHPIAVSRPSRDRLHLVAVRRTCHILPRPKESHSTMLSRSLHTIHRRALRVHAPPSPAPVDHEPPVLLDKRLRQLPRSRRQRPAGHLPGLRVSPPPELMPAADGRRHSADSRSSAGHPIIG